MLSNPFFWLGELGLILSIVSCAILMHRFRHASLLVTLPFWLFLIMSLNMLVRPAIYNLNHTIPASPYLYRLAIGLLLASRVWVWRTISKPKEVLDMDRVFKWVSISAVVGLAYIVYRIRQLGR